MGSFTAENLQQPHCIKAFSRKKVLEIEIVTRKHLSQLAITVQEPTLSFWWRKLSRPSLETWRKSLRRLLKFFSASSAKRSNKWNTTNRLNRYIVTCFARQEFHRRFWWEPGFHEHICVLRTPAEIMVPLVGPWYRIYDIWQISKISFINSTRLCCWFVHMKSLTITSSLIWGDTPCKKWLGEV